MASVVSNIVVIVIHILLTFIYLVRGQETIIFSAISNLDAGTSGKSVVGAQWLAIQEINNDPNLLPDHQLVLEAHDAEGQSGKALVHALNIIDFEQEKNETYFPVILGCPWSSLSTITSPALGSFENGQISSGATSIALSDTSRYPHFYRTIPSDSLQAQGIIEFAKAFNWTKIAVIYVNDAYGVYLSIGIHELALENDIEATTIAYSRESPSTLANAAKQISKLETYIIVLIVHDADTNSVFKQLQDEKLTGYPYYYIGVDAWFDTGRILNNNVSNYTQGFIGTVPWQTDAMPLESYQEDIQPIIEKSIQVYDGLLQSWAQYWQNEQNRDYLYKLEYPSSTAIYGYDSMYTLAYALEIYLQDNTIIDGYINITKLNDIIIGNKISNDVINNEKIFIGASGNVRFDENGDRSQGLYAFGNALSNGTVNYFGYFYQHNDNLTLSVDYNKIIWPEYFLERNIRPRSDVLIIDSIQDISHNILIPIYVLSSISIIIAIIYGLLTCKYHDTRVLRAASWRINLVMCIGCLFGYISMIIYGIDEHWVKAGPAFTFLCNLRLWLWIFSYTLLFMPLFMKTYRLSRIFSEILEKKHLEDRKLLYYIGICLFVDLLLLTIYTAIEPLQRLYISGAFRDIDQLQREHYIYGSCETTNKTQYIYYGLIALWKIIETLFGIYCALSVSRVGRKELSQFDETTQQLLAILFLIVALCIALPVGALGNSDDPSYFYAVIGFLTISVGNVTTTLNMLPRLLALILGNADQKYSQSPQDKMEDLIVEQLRRIGIDEQWWKKASNVDQTNEIFRARKSGSRFSGFGKRKNRNNDLSEDHSGISAVQLAIPTHSGQSGLTSTAERVASMSPGPMEEDDDEEPDSDIREQQERELNKKTSETPINATTATMTPMSSNIINQIDLSTPDPHSPQSHQE